MTWIAHGIEARVGWMVGDLLSALAVFIALMTLCMLWMLPTWYRQWRCPHERYFETRGCDAVCNRCRKNLGFIGTVQRQRGGS